MSGRPRRPPLVQLRVDGDDGLVRIATRPRRGRRAATLVDRRRRSVMSLGSFFSAFSVLSLFSFASIASVGSSGSILSIGSNGSVLSIGSVGSILSIGSAGSILSIGSVGGILSKGRRRRRPDPPMADEA
jgi:hypothetical protein